MGRGKRNTQAAAQPAAQPAARVVQGEEDEEDVPAPSQPPPAARVVQGEEDEDDTPAQPTPAAQTAPPVAQPTLAARVVQGEEDEDDAPAVPVEPPTLPARPDASAEQPPQPLQQPEQQPQTQPQQPLPAQDTGEIQRMTVLPSEPLGNSERQRRLAELMPEFSQAMDATFAVPLRGVRRTLVQLSAAVAKSEKVVQEVSFNLNTFHNDLKSLDAALHKVPRSLWTPVASPPLGAAPDAKPTVPASS